MSSNGVHIEIEIDGKKIAAKPGSMVIQAADSAGIYIPRFCYHEKLSVAANCRMCLIEVGNSKKPLPACATPVMEGMKVFTASKLAMDAQKAVMEFLLINHPLDCPICDQGGECELQDLSLGYGSCTSPFNSEKRVVADEDLGPLISTEMTRCIHCTRCVRFGKEVAGMRELGATGRGEDMQIGTYVKHFMQSELSGNIIDLCPVGALTSKPYRFSGRSFEMRQHESIAPHDGIGSNIYIHTRGFIETDYRQVMRVVPKDHEGVNENWLSDRDRFSYQAVNSSERILKPRIKDKTGWKEVDWVDALHVVSESLKAFQPKNIAGLASSSSTLEELYLFKQLFDGLGSPNVDHRLHQTDFRQAIEPSLGVSLEDLESQDAILLVGSNIRYDQPLGNHRIRKAALKGAAVMAVNPVDYKFNFNLNQKLIVGTEGLFLALVSVIKCFGKVVSGFEAIEVQEIHQAIADQLRSREKRLILLGAHALNHPEFASIHVLAQLLAELSGAKIGYLSEGANAAGAYLAKVLPAADGMNAKTMFCDPRDAYVLLNVEPERDSAYSAQAHHALKKAFVVMLSPFSSKEIEEYADVILPISPFTETSGTFVNLEGRWQSFTAATRPMGMVRPAWKVLRVLGNLLGLKPFHYDSSEQIRDELRSVMPEKSGIQKACAVGEVLDASLRLHDNVLRRIADHPMYSIDLLSRRASALQKVEEEQNLACIAMHPELAIEKGFQEGQRLMAVQGESELILPVKFDARLVKNNVFIPLGLKETAGFGEAFAPIELKPLVAEENSGDR